MTTPSQNELKELERLFKLDQLDLLKKKTEELINNYPNVSILYNILGIVLQKKNYYNDAILNFKKAIQIQPTSDQAHNNLGNTLQNIKKFNEAITSYKNAIKYNPNYAEAYSNLGNALAEMGKFDEAIINQKQALKLKPQNAELYSNLGNSLSELGKITEAVKNYKQALKINPNYVEVYSNLGNALAEIGKFDEAITNHQNAYKLNPKYKKAYLNESIVRLTLGEFKNGWEKYEARLGDGTNTPLRYPKDQIWNGEYVDGTLLVWGEQGLGDHIIFASMLTDLKKCAKKIILEIDTRLKNLLIRYFEKINFSNIKIINSEKDIIFDKHIAIGSLGKYLRQSKKSFEKTPKKFFIASSLKENELKNKFTERKFKVGISWRTLNKKQKYRDINLEQMLPILSNTNCDFVNLQFGNFDHDLEKFKLKYDLNIRSINEIDNYNDIDGLAALINCLDLVITIQNTTAHLSGALGKKTWVMLAYNARWHWLRNENYSLWYPSAKLFRQKKIGNWNDVINNISIELKSLSYIAKN